MSARKHPDPEWFAIVRPGDVLRAPSGALRVVRSVRRRENGRLRAIQFVKRRCSRYPSPTTIYFDTDFRQQRWEYVGARVKLDQPFDHDIALHCEHHSNGVLRQCDVVGIMP